MSRLQYEKSPYLLQHIKNPVDWFPWGPIALTQARTEKKLIFLSIGYSTCHWCHVMAHECFQDKQIANLLKDDYISIKVDREERPDIDQVYMEVCQRLTGSGGWPLTIIMTPEALPFFAATYIPKLGRYGRPGLMELLPGIAQRWRDAPDVLSNAAQDVVVELQKQHLVSNGPVSIEDHIAAEKALRNSFDSKFGGFGNAPKFPRPHDLMFLLCRYHTTGNQTCLKMVEQTLMQMRCGGIYDHLGFGFHRYSTDRKWLVPHFEKMLYDQSGLIKCYVHTWLSTGKQLYADVANEILTYVLRDMQSPEGGFYSAEDADSEGEEGGYFIWSKEEILACLGDTAEAFCQTFHILDSGNFHDETTGKNNGKNILHQLPETNLQDQKFNQFKREREVLFRERSKRIRPHRDDKIITSWNGMMISALADASRMMNNCVYLSHAQKAARFIMTKLRNNHGRILRRYCDGDASISAFSEDYAYLLRGLLDLYAADYECEWLDWSLQIAHRLKEFFQDHETGKLYDTPVDGEQLLIRPATSFDGAIPAASSIAIECFSRLFLITANPAWHRAAQKLLGSLSAFISKYPAGYTQALLASDWLRRPTKEILIVGPDEDEETQKMLAITRKIGLRQVVTLYKSELNTDELTRIAPYTENMYAINAKGTAYVCSNFCCQEPLTSADELRINLEKPLC